MHRVVASTERLPSLIQNPLSLSSAAGTACIQLLIHPLLEYAADQIIQFVSNAISRCFWFICARQWPYKNTLWLCDGWAYKYVYSKPPICAS